MGVVTMKCAAIIFVFSFTFFSFGCAIDFGLEKTPSNSSPAIESSSSPAVNDTKQDMNKNTKNDKSSEDTEYDKDTKEIKDNEETELKEEHKAGKVAEGITDAIEQKDEKEDKTPKSNDSQASDKVDVKSDDSSDSAEDVTTAGTPVPKTPKSILEELFDNTVFYPMVILILALVALSVWLIYDRQKRKNMMIEPNNKRTERIIILNDTLDTNPIPSNLLKENIPHFAVGNFHNIGKRDEQQDSFCLSNIGDENALCKKGAMAVVADGMGGMEGGAIISQTVTDIFREKYSRIESIKNPRVFLLEAAQEAEKAVEAYMSHSGVEGGSTLVAVLVKQSILHFISIGDSHIYIWRHGQITRINREHNYGELLKEKAARGEVAQDEPYINPRRHALTAYIGKGKLNIFDQGEHSLVIGDKILLCSDGVYNALGDDALATVLADDAMMATQKIERQILIQNLPKQDNFTGIILEYLG